MKAAGLRRSVEEPPGLQSCSLLPQAWPTFPIHNIKQFHHHIHRFCEASERTYLEEFGLIRTCCKKRLNWQRPLLALIHLLFTKGVLLVGLIIVANRVVREIVLGKDFKSTDHSHCVLAILSGKKVSHKKEIESEERACISIFLPPASMLLSWFLEGVVVTLAQRCHIIL
jgi:hypothetical protein